MIRTLVVMVAGLLFIGAIPAGIRAERAAQAGSPRRVLWESARCLLAIAAASALLITALWG